MRKEEFIYLKGDNEKEKVELYVIKESPKYIEGYSKKDEEMEKLYNQLLKYYRKYRKDKILDKQYYVGDIFGSLGAEFEKYANEINLNYYSKQTQEEIRYLVHNIYSNLNDLAVLLNTLYTKEEDENEVS